MQSTFDNDRPEECRKNDANILYEQGNQFFHEKNYAMAISAYCDAIKIYQPIDSALCRIGECYKAIADSYKHLANFDQACGYYKRSFPYFRISSVTREFYRILLSDDEINQYLVEIYTNISEIYSAKNNFDKALRYTKRIYEIQDKIDSNPSQKAANILENMAGLAEKAQDFPFAFTCYKKLLEIYISLHMTAEILSCQLHLQAVIPQPDQEKLHNENIKLFSIPYEHKDVCGSFFNPEPKCNQKNTILHHIQEMNLRSDAHNYMQAVIDTIPKKYVESNKSKQLSHIKNSLFCPEEKTDIKSTLEKFLKICMHNTDPVIFSRKSSLATNAGNILKQASYSKLNNLIGFTSSSHYIDYSVRFSSEEVTNIGPHSKRTRTR